MDQGELERRSTNLFGDALWMPIYVLKLGIVNKMKEGDSWADRYCCVLAKALKQEGKKPSTKTHKSQHLVTPCVHVLQQKHRHIALKNSKLRKYGGIAKLLSKRMKEDKEKCQEQIAKSHKLSSPRAFTSES
ncbi:hypothetical protein A6R68_01786, partial [Neotoma lepida]